MDHIVDIHIQSDGHITCLGVNNAVLSNGNHRGGSLIVEHTVVLNALRDTDHRQCQLTRSRAGAGVKYALRVAGGNLSVKGAQTQLIRSSHGTGNIAKVHIEGLRTAEIVEHHRNRGEGIGTIDHKLHPAVHGGVGLAVIGHADIFIGNGHQHTINTVKRAVDRLAFLHIQQIALGTTEFDGIVGRRTGDAGSQIIDGGEGSVLIVGIDVIRKEVHENLSIGNRAGMDHGHMTEAVNDHRSGVGVNVQQILPGGIGHSKGQIITGGLGEALNRCLLILRVQAQQDNLIGKLGIGLLHMRELGLAGLAVLIPEVQDHRLTLRQQFAVSISGAIHRRNGEVRHGIAQGQASLHLRDRAAAGGQKDLSINGNGIGLIQGVTAADRLQNSHIVVAGLGLEGHNTFFISLAEPNHFIQSIVGIHTDTHIGQCGADLIFDRNLILFLFHHRVRLNRTVGGVNIGLGLIAANQQQDRDQHRHRQQNSDGSDDNSLLVACNKILHLIKEFIHYLCPFLRTRHNST